MKTPEEVKRSLDAHCRPYSCGECAYEKMIYCRDALMKDISELFREMEAQVPKWISVKERLPEKDEEVLCFFVYPDLTTMCQNVYYGGGRWLGEGNFVTHWMPLPEPPKELKS